METESLMAASTLGIHNEVSTSGQLAKPSFNGDQGPGNGAGFWDDEERSRGVIRLPTAPSARQHTMIKAVTARGSHGLFCCVRPASPAPGATHLTSLSAAIRPVSAARMVHIARPFGPFGHARRTVWPCRTNRLAPLGAYPDFCWNWLTRSLFLLTKSFHPL